MSETSKRKSYTPVVSETQAAKKPRLSKEDEGNAVALFIPQTPTKQQIFKKSDGWRAISRSEIGLSAGQTPKEFKTPTKRTTYRRVFSVQTGRQKFMLFTSVDSFEKKSMRKQTKYPKTAEQIKENLPANKKNKKEVEVRITKKRLRDWEGKSDKRHPSQKSVMGNVSPNNYADVINGGSTVPAGVSCDWAHLAGHFTGGPKGGPQQQRNLVLTSAAFNEREMRTLEEILSKYGNQTDIDLYIKAKLIPSSDGKGYTDVAKSIDYKITHVDSGRHVIGFFQSPLKNTPPSKKCKRLAGKVIAESLLPKKLFA